MAAIMTAASACCADVADAGQKRTQRPNYDICLHLQFASFTNGTGRYWLLPSCPLQCHCRCQEALLRHRAGPYDAGPCDACQQAAGPDDAGLSDSCQHALSNELGPMMHKWLRHQALITTKAACLHAPENKVWQVQVTLNTLHVGIFCGKLL